MLTLLSYNVSPYAAKVRAVLRYKRVPFVERVVHPLARGELKRRSGQLAVPVVDDGTTVVHDSTRIIAWLDERHPDRPVLPRDATLRARALLLEEAFDEGLGSTVQPVRWLIPANARKTAAKFRSAYPPGIVDGVRMAIVNRVMRLDQRRKYGSRAMLAPSRDKIIARLTELCDTVEAALAETGWLAGPAPSVADFALYGWLGLLDGLDGWDVVQSRPRVARLVGELGTAAPSSTEDLATEPRQARRSS